MITARQAALLRQVRDDPHEPPSDRHLEGTGLDVGACWVFDAEEYARDEYARNGNVHKFLTVRGHAALAEYDAAEGTRADA